MKQPRNTVQAALRLVVGLSCALVVAVESEALERLELAPGESNWVEPVFRDGERSVIQTEDLTVITVPVMVQHLINYPVPGIEVQNEGFVPVGFPRAGGRFWNAAAPIGIDHGAILSSGNIASVKDGGIGTENTSDSTSSANAGAGGFPPLVAILDFGGVWDESILTFDIKNTAGHVQVLVFEFVFASEEYNEWVPSRYNDGFGIWITGPLGTVNVALLPPPGGAGPWVPVTVHNVNQGAQGWDFTKPNAALFKLNDCDDLAGPGGGPGFACAAPFSTEMDGMTVVRRSQPFALEPSPDPPNELWYTIEIAIGDASDPVWDSDVFLKAYFGGACCTCDGRACVCEDGVVEADCPGTWTAGKLCSEVGCGGTEGACCLPDGTCVIVDQAGCEAADGIYAGDGTDCATVGACCFTAGGVCVEMTPDCCAVAGGVYQGDDTTCTPLGACYLSDLVCVETTEACCIEAVGTYEGDATVCEPIGACCDSNDECTLVQESDCNGDFLGDGTYCGPGVCPGKPPIPAVTEWGLLVMVLLGLVAGTIMYRKWQTVPA